MIPEIERIRSRLESGVRMETNPPGLTVIPDRSEDIRSLLDCVGVLWAALAEIERDTSLYGRINMDCVHIEGCDCQREFAHEVARASLSDARKILGSEQEAGAGHGAS